MPLLDLFPTSGFKFCLFLQLRLCMRNGSFVIRTKGSDGNCLEWAWGESPIPTVSRWAALINDSPSVQPLPSHLADPPTWAHPQAYWNPGKGILTPHPFSLPLTSQPTLLETTLLEDSVFFWNLVEFLKAEEATWPSVEVSIISKSQCSQLLGSSLFGWRPNGH